MFVVLSRVSQWTAGNHHFGPQVNYFFLCRNLLYVILIGPCIVIYSYSTTNKMHLLSQIICSCKTFYMFRTVFPSISRSSKLRIQQLFDIYCCCVRSFELLMMDGKTETCGAFYKNK